MIGSPPGVSNPTSFRHSSATVISSDTAQEVRPVKDNENGWGLTMLAGVQLRDDDVNTGEARVDAE